jgi:hypothetical protein
MAISSILAVLEPARPMGAYPNPSHCAHDTSRNQINLNSRTASNAFIDRSHHHSDSSRVNRISKYFLLSFALVNFTIAGVSDAAAYLDPGSGSILFQGTVAVVASGLAIFATAWRSIAGFFGRAFKRRADGGTR